MSDPIIKRGTWMYDGDLPSAVVITCSDCFIGSGDYEDPPEVYLDCEVETFTVWFESPPRSGSFHASGGQQPSLDAAMAAATRLAPSPVRWE